MHKAKAWTIIETMVTVGVIGLLATVVMPCLYGAKEMARLAVCSSQMHNIHPSLMSYAAENGGRLPPFAFSSWMGDLPLSGHWGGASQEWDPDAFGRLGVDSVNLWVLVDTQRIAASELICPCAAGELRNAQHSYFPHSLQYSTYCLRFPASEALFNGSAHLANYGGSLLGVYAAAAGGQRIRVGTRRQTVPQVRISRRYRITPSASCGDGSYDVARDAMLSDAFWRRAYYREAPQVEGLAGYPTQSDWSHATKFNVLYGDGSVGTISDDGTVAANSAVDGVMPADETENYAGCAERVWQFFDAAK